LLNFTHNSSSHNVLPSHINIHHREFDELSAKGEKVGEQTREMNQHQAASQNTQDTSCVDEMVNDDGEEEEEEGKVGDINHKGTDEEQLLKKEKKEVEMKNSKFGDNNDGNDNDQNCV
jgi:hypothetical protein